VRPRTTCARGLAETSVFDLWVRIQLAYHGVIATCPHGGAAISPPSRTLSSHSPSSLAGVVLSRSLYLFSINFIYSSGGAHGPIVSPLPYLLHLHTPFASVPFHSSSTITTQNSTSLQISSSAQSLDTFRSECCRSGSTPGVVGDVVNVGGVGGEVRRRVIVGVVPVIDNVGDGFDAAAYAEYPWLCDLPDSTSAGPPLRLAAQRKVNSYRQQYADNQNISFLPANMTTCSRMHGEFLRLLFLQAPPRDHGALHCHWTAIATKPIGQCVPAQTRGILHGPEEQSRPRGGKSIGITDQPQYPRL
jgi:hypothetical protein